MTPLPGIADAAGGSGAAPAVVDVAAVAAGIAAAVAVAVVAAGCAAAPPAPSCAKIGLGPAPSLAVGGSVTAIPCGNTTTGTCEGRAWKAPRRSVAMDAAMAAEEAVAGRGVAPSAVAQLGEVKAKG